MAITTSNSINVKAARRVECEGRLATLADPDRDIGSAVFEN